MIYLDYAASSKPFPDVISRVCSTAAEAFGNPGALHHAGSGARKILQDSRFVLAGAMNVRPEEIFFTSGGTESNNWAVSLACAASGKHHILCSAAEHSSVLEPLRQLRKKGYHITYLNPDRQGSIHPDALEQAIRPDTGLVCVQAVNNETGVIQDVDALARIARKHRVPYFCDAVQSFGHIRQELRSASLISLSAHKLGGPRGVGCLVIRQPFLPAPMLHGGGQEFGYRSGTENLPGIAGFALAAELSLRQLSQEQPRLLQLRTALEESLRHICPDLEIAGENAQRSSILCCRFPGFSAEEMVTRLDQEGICASPGAACAARSHAPSHVLLSMGYSPAEASEFVRFSPGWDTTREDIANTADAIRKLYRRK